MLSKVIIKHIEPYFPSQILTSAEAAASTGLSEDLRKNKLGINSVHIAQKDEHVSDMATSAIKNLLNKHKIQKETIDLLIVVTQNPDYRLPTTACLVQNKVGLSKNLLAYDVNQGCSGFIVGLAQSVALIKSGFCKCAILVTVEAYNKIISNKDKDTYGLFGDAACATLLVPSFNHDEQGFSNFFFGTDGSGAQDLIHECGGTISQTLQNPRPYLYMNGRSIFEFVSQTISSDIKNFLLNKNINLDQIDHWIFHQANKFMNSRLISSLNIPTEKAFFDIHDIGNTVSSSIPIAIHRFVNTHGPQSGNWFFSGFGVGLSWGGCIYKGIIK